MENLINGLKQFDRWMNNQSWITATLAFLQTSLVTSVKGSWAACMYSLVITVALAISTLLVGHSAAVTIYVAIMVIASLVIMVRVLDGATAMQHSVIFMSILDMTRTYFLLVLATYTISGLICVFEPSAIPVVIFSAASDFFMLMALLFAKNIVVAKN